MKLKFLNYFNVKKEMRFEILCFTFMLKKALPI